MSENRYGESLEDFWDECPGCGMKFPLRTTSEELIYDRHYQQCWEDDVEEEL